VNTAPRLDSEPVLAGLKDFQRATVDYVFRRFYSDNPPAKRFLVADEVGLGKTLVARGLIARAIEHLQSVGTKRIDVLYVCSNADIAGQNISRLNVTGRQEFNLPTRITLLPLQLHQLNAQGINFVSFTPGTSFDLKSRGGVVQERALLYWLLRHAWGWPKQRHQGVFRVLRGSAGVANYRNSVHSTPSEVGAGANQIDPGLAEAFKKELQGESDRANARGESSLHERFEELASRYRKTERDVDPEARQRLVGDLRHTLARSCVNALEPDLIILDEFQRFRNLLDGNDAAAELAQHLFAQESSKVLLLSATPYKMYTLPEEAQAHEDHYADFVRTVRFLMGSDEAGQFAKDLESFRHGLLEADVIDLGSLRTRRRRVERHLRRVMTRTERLADTTDRNGMLTEKSLSGTMLTEADLRGYLAADCVSRRLGGGDMVEYWKSAPYLLNFMESYKLKRSFREALDEEASRAEIGEMLTAGGGLLSMPEIEAYHRIDPGNARLRSLVHDTLDNESWRLLWLPPALPYYQPGSPFGDSRHAQFTKRLVFSAWWVVPQAIATLLSYEAERRMVRSGGRNWRNTAEARRRVRPLLRFQRQGERLGGMPSFALMYPSPALARLGDPFAIARSLGAAKRLPSLDEALSVAERQIERSLRRVLPARGTQSGPIDERWYWAAPILLDSHDANSRNVEWFGQPNHYRVWNPEAKGATDPEASALAEAVALARDTAGGSLSLGRVPPDLVQILARLALAGPAVCGLRALSRVAGGIAHVSDVHLRNGAAQVGWGFRSLFNVPEVMAMVRGREQRDEEVYWQRVLDYCANGGLQAVLDEYAHVLREWMGILSRDPAEVGPKVGKAINDALTVRAANYRVEDIRVGGLDNVAVEPKNLRARYALRFGAQHAEEGGDVQRANQVRLAFNSPFWPFVLASTSVGQEGLDFHVYCHAVVHWNLPANPVDLEQREGRVHRYKGHAIRKNVAAANRIAGFKKNATDPWEAMFDAARRGRPRSSGDIVPYWIYPTEGGAKIERYVPALPLSREIEKLEQLKRSLAVYRLAFGQPRQEDLALYLDALPAAKRTAVATELRIDLTPR